MNNKAKNHIESLRKLGYQNIDELLRPIEEFFIPNQPKKSYIMINGLEWETTNLIVGDKELFTFDEARDYASQIGKRLPTKNEFEELIKYGYTWDRLHKGVWMGHDHHKRNHSSASIFFPISGYTLSNEPPVSIIGSCGHYWSDTPYSFINSFHLLISRSLCIVQAESPDCNNRELRFAVRCILD